MQNTTIKHNISELIENYKGQCYQVENLLDCFLEISENGGDYGYEIQKIVNESCPCYWSDLYKWFNEASANQFIENYVNEFMQGSEFNLFDAFSGGWVLYHQDAAASNQDEIVKLWALNWLSDNGIDALTPEQLGDVEKACEINRGFYYLSNDLQEIIDATEEEESDD